MTLASSPTERVSPKMPEPSEKQVQKAAVDAFHMLGFWTWNLSQPRATMQSRGLSDFIAVGRGRVVFVEVKRPGGRQTRDQMQFQDHLEANNGHYLLVRSAADVVRFVQDLPRVASPIGDTE